MKGIQRRGIPGIPELVSLDHWNLRRFRQECSRVFQLEGEAIVSLSPRGTDHVGRSFYIIDRGYLDFARLHRLHLSSAFFVTRAKQNFRYRRRYSRPVDKTTGLRFDQTVILTGYYARRAYPEALQRIGFCDPQTGKALVFLTNNFTEPALTIAQLYRCHWRIELFFKWIKQHLRIKAFYGTSDNAVHVQLWIAITAYLLVAILKKRLRAPPLASMMAGRSPRCGGT